MDLKIIPSENDKVNEPWPHEFDTIEKVKELGKWPFDFLSAYGMMPYLKRMKGDVKGIEIGVLKGENVALLLEEVPGINLICGVDHYKEHTDYGVTRSQEDMDKYLSIAEENLKPFGERYQLIKEESGYAAAGFEDEGFDFILIDGNHSYEGIKSDLVAYYPKLKKGGYIFIHDCFDEGVMRAVHEFREENRLRMPLNMSKNYVNFWIKS